MIAHRISPTTGLVLAFLMSVAAPAVAREIPEVLQVDPHGNKVAAAPIRSQGPPAPAAPSTPSGSIVFGVDARDGFSQTEILATGSLYDEFRNVFTSRGITIAPLISFEAADLVGLDAVVIKIRYTLPNNPPYSPSEMTALHDFVAGGGGLLAVADGGTGSDVFNFNEVVAPYGVAFSALETDPSGRVVSGFTPHPITQGVSTVGVDYQRHLTSIVPPSIDLTLSGDSLDNILAADDGQAGSGNAIFISDGSLWGDEGEGPDTPISFGDNRRVLENILSHIGRRNCSLSLSLSLDPGVLWPPNHKLADIHASIQLDSCDPSPTVTLVSVASSELDDGVEDGDLPDDIQGATLGTDDRDFQLRSERAGSGSGRMYVACYEARNASGNTVQACDTVLVPHDQRGRARLIQEPDHESLVIFGVSPLLNMLPSSVELRTDSFVRLAIDDPPGYRDIDGDGLEDGLFSLGASTAEIRQLANSGVLFARWQCGDQAFLATVSPTGALAVPRAEPLRLAVSAWPNPAGESVRLRYVLPEAGRVRLRVFDVTGREVAHLVDGERSAGQHDMHWSGARGAAQVYHVLLETRHGTVGERFIRVR